MSAAVALSRMVRRVAAALFVVALMAVAAVYRAVDTVVQGVHCTAAARQACQRQCQGCTAEFQSFC